MIVNITGVKSGTTKNDKPFFQYYGTTEFTGYERQSGTCDGLQVVSEFSYVDYGVRPGDICNFEYAPGYQGKAMLSNITIQSSK